MQRKPKVIGTGDFDILSLEEESKTAAPQGRNSTVKVSFIEQLILDVFK